MSEPKIPFEDWCKQLDSHHERQRAAGVFKGYGPGSVIEKTGAECWRHFYDYGLCPEDALDEDRECWE